MNFTKIDRGKPEFFLPRVFQRGSRNCRSPSDSLANSFFVGSYWTPNPAVWENVHEKA